MNLGNLFDCLATRERLLFAIQSRYGPIVGLDKRSLSELAQMAIRLGVRP